MLVITSENDDRVPPFNSYKFVARMQSRKAQQNPIILKIEADAGHYGANTFSKRMKKNIDVYGFIVNELMGK
jgi:prolyl oligopeptidase